MMSLAILMGWGISNFSMQGQVQEVIHQFCHWYVEPPSRLHANFGKQEQETTDHFLFSCEFSCTIWKDCILKTSFWISRDTPNLAATLQDIETALANDNA